MKLAVKLFCVLVVGLIVFTGALMISEGLRVRRDAPAAAPESVPFLTIDLPEGSAL